MNTDRSHHLTSFAWTDRLRRSGVPVWMKDKGQFLYIVLVERLWRRDKYECLYLYALKTGSEAKAGVGKWIDLNSP
ncbi:MAG: hypothetical protein AAF636_16925 [Pseudomonadota bacterium]